MENDTNLRSRHCAATSSQLSCCCEERYAALINEEVSRRVGRFTEAIVFIRRIVDANGDDLKILGCGRLSGSAPLSRHAATQEKELKFPVDFQRECLHGRRVQAGRRTLPSRREGGQLICILKV